MSCLLQILNDRLLLVQCSSACGWTERLPLKANENPPHARSFTVLIVIFAAVFYFTSVDWEATLTSAKAKCLQLHGTKKRYHIQNPFMMVSVEHYQCGSRGYPILLQKSKMPAAPWHKKRYRMQYRRIDCDFWCSVLHHRGVNWEFCKSKMQLA